MQLLCFSGWEWSEVRGDGSKQYEVLDFLHARNSLSGLYVASGDGLY